ncbi:MAG: lysozyme inhibitor LprI family protein [Deltaproteobacteria bacterium]|jgi:uncharacterized protein YecT (DUF1311 family)|nr:lysozyme inhibitor LprI family protein [Deltaproteobacteria bacterium]
MKALLLAAALMLTAPISVLMAQDGLSSQCLQCLENTGGVVPDMIDCLQAEYEKQDARLNAAYKKVRAGESEEQAKKLRTAQRAWIQFRDAYGDYLYDPEGGTDARVSAMIWLVVCTTEQAERLERLSPAR